MRQLIGLVGALLMAAVAHAAAPPHVVVFIRDDHGYLDSSLAGSPDVGTPNLARAAAAGMELTHAFCASPTCAPSRASLLTGLWPVHNGAMINHQSARAGVKKWPAYFQELGYEVVAFGKVAHYEQVTQYGFDLYRHHKFHDDRCVTAAVEWLAERKSDKPLCLMVGTNWPHVPWPEEAPAFDPAKLTLPPTHVDTPETRRYRARYYAAVEKMDADLGLVYDATYKHLGPGTLFVTFSDHGAQWPLGKWDCYEAGTRTPIVAVWPGVIAAGSKSAAFVSLTDVLPTVLELTGSGAPAGIDGRSFAGVLKGTAASGREKVFLTHSGDKSINAYPIRAVRTERWKYIRNLKPEAVHTTHMDRAKPVDGRTYWESWVAKAKMDAAAAAIVQRYRRRPAEELYDLEADPFELRNLAADSRHAEMLARLRRDLDAWMAEQGDGGLATEEAAAAEFLSAEK
jgi:uncharacterized sulfatase